MPPETRDPATIKNQEILSTAALSGSAILLAIGVLALAGAGSFGLIPVALHAPAQPHAEWLAGLAVIGAVLLVWVGFKLPAQVATLETLAENQKEPDRSTALYGIYLVGIGFALLLQAATCSIVFAAVAWSVGLLGGGNAFPKPEPPTADIARLFGSTAGDAFSVLGLFALSSLVAVLGSLFFFANSMYQKMDAPERNPFDRRVFWGGLWFRLGEAVLFNLVFFLVLRYFSLANYILLPLVSLLVGMFLKAGESLVSGIADRVFASIQALVPSQLETKKSPRLLTFRVGGYSADETPDEMKTRVENLVTAITALAGVEQVDADAGASLIRVEYDPAAVSPGDVDRKVRLKGLQIMPPPASPAQGPPAGV